MKKQQTFVMLCDECMQPTGDDNHLCKKHRPKTNNSERANFTQRQKDDAYEKQQGLCWEGYTEGIHGGCGKREFSNNPFVSHHRNGDKTNKSDSNCVLMHSGCHNALELKVQAKKRKKRKKKSKSKSWVDKMSDDFDRWGQI